MTALEYLTAIRFSGTEAGDFLHNQLSSDVLALSDGESVFACYCEPKGRVLALMLVCRVDEDYYIIMSSALAAPVSARLRMYVMRSKVSIEVLNDATVSGMQTLDTPEPAVLPAISVPLPDGGKTFSILTDGTTVETEVSLQDAWKASELDRGICWLCPETSAQFLPQMLGRQFWLLAVRCAGKFQRGDYPGTG